MYSQRLGISLIIGALSLLGCSSSDNKNNDKKEPLKPPISETPIITLDFH